MIRLRVSEQEVWGSIPESAPMKIFLSHADMSTVWKLLVDFEYKNNRGVTQTEPVSDILKLFEEEVVHGKQFD